MFASMRALLARLGGVGHPADHPVAIVPENSVAVVERAQPAHDQRSESDDRVIAVAVAAPQLPDGQETLLQARRLVTSGATTQAIALVRTQLRDQPDPEVATALLELETIQRTRKRLRRRPQDAMAHFELGRALFAQEQGAEALEHLTVACHLRPSWLEAHLLRAYELHWQGRWHDAETAYQSVLHLDPAHATARRGLLAVRICQPPDALLVTPESYNGGMAAG